jgi:hypothetical protein
MARKKPTKAPAAAKDRDAPDARADAGLMTMTVAALTPVVQSMMALSEANARRHEQAVRENAAAQASDLVAVAASVDSLLRR